MPVKNNRFLWSFWYLSFNSHNFALTFYPFVMSLVGYGSAHKQYSGLCQWSFYAGDAVLATYSRQSVLSTWKLSLALAINCTCLLYFPYPPCHWTWPIYPSPLLLAVFTSYFTHWTLNIIGFVLPIGATLKVLMNHHQHGYIHHPQLVIISLLASGTCQIAKFGRLFYNFQGSILKLYISIATYLNCSLLFPAYLLSLDVWNWFITIVLLKTLTVRINSLVLARNVLPLLLNVFGKILKTLKVLELQHVVKQQDNLLWALKTSITILKIRNVWDNGFSVQRSIRWKNQASSLLFNFYFYVATYCQQREYFHRR